MKCKKCKSENLQVVKSGPHNKLVCADCLAFQKFLSASELKIFKELQATNQPLQQIGEMIENQEDMPSEFNRAVDKMLDDKIANG